MSTLLDRIGLEEAKLPPEFKTWAAYYASKKGKKGKKPKPLPPSKAKASPSPMTHFNPKFGKDKLPQAVFDELRHWAATRKIKPEDFARRVERTIRKGGLKQTRKYVKLSAGNREKLLRLGPKVLSKKGKPSKKGKAISLPGLVDVGDDWGAAEPKTMGTSWGKSSEPKWKPKPPKPVSPETARVREMAAALKKKYSKIKRQAAGGLVFKTFEGPDILQLPVCVAWTHPKWGAPHPVFPKGGLDAGESLTQGAIREVKEESGVTGKVVASKPYITKSSFGDRGRYDWRLIMKLLKRMFPKEAKFIDANVEAVKYDTSFTYENANHYYVMSHVSGKPHPGGDEHEEMSKAAWVPLGQAYKMGHRMKEIIKALFPEIKKLWKPTGGASKQSVSLSSLRTPRPREKKAKPDYTPSTAKGSSAAPKPAQAVDDAWWVGMV